METDYQSLEYAQNEIHAEEWLNRVHDFRFLYFYKRGRRYEPLLWTSSDFRKPKYGYEMFRELQEKIEPRFKTVLPPIPLFEKYGQTYSQGEV